MKDMCSERDLFVFLKCLKKGGLFFKLLKYIWLTVLFLLGFYSFCECGFSFPMDDSKDKKDEK